MACGRSVPGFKALGIVSFAILAFGVYTIKEQCPKHSSGAALGNHGLGLAAQESGSTDAGSASFLPRWRSTERARMVRCSAVSEFLI